MRWKVAVLRRGGRQDLGDGLRLLVADYGLSCPNDDPDGFLFIWSIVFVAVYPIGQRSAACEALPVQGVTWAGVVQGSRCSCT